MAAQLAGRPRGDDPLSFRTGPLAWRVRRNRDAKPESFLSGDRCPGRLPGEVVSGVAVALLRPDLPAAFHQIGERGHLDPPRSELQHSEARILLATGPKGDWVVADGL